MLQDGGKHMKPANDRLAAVHKYIVLKTSLRQHLAPGACFISVRAHPHETNIAYDWSKIHLVQNVEMQRDPWSDFDQF